MFMNIVDNIIPDNIHGISIITVIIDMSTIGIILQLLWYGYAYYSRP